MFVRITILEPGPKLAMDKIICDELAEGMISIVDFLPHCVHALGAVEKPDGGIRPITDCSRPTGKSINNFSDGLVEDFRYMSINDVTSNLVQGDFMSVIDIKSAYRAVSIRPDHRKYLGFRWELDGVLHTFCDNRLCFGLRIGPCHFGMISSFIARVMKNVLWCTILTIFCAKGLRTKSANMPKIV